MTTTVMPEVSSGIDYANNTNDTETFVKNELARILNTLQVKSYRSVIVGGMSFELCL